MAGFGINRLDLLRLLIILTAGFWVFSPALRGDWLWDDSQLIVDNRVMQDPAGLWKTWSRPDTLNAYLPLTVDVEWIEWHLWRTDTLPYHLLNVVLHQGSALLLWRLFSKLGLRLAWLGGLLFAIHPLMVESVAWIAELKNTLSLPPLLLAMCAWIEYDRTGRWKDYLLALGLFLIAMLCKTTMVFFPFVLLLHAWWRRDRIGWRDLLAGAPFFLISLVLGLVIVWLEKHYGQHATETASWPSRIATVGQALVFLISKCLCPVHLLPIYPSGIVTAPTLLDFLPCLLLPLLLGGLWLRRDGWGRHALLGLGFFLLNLVPVLAFILKDLTSMIWSLDHLLYIPIIGLIGLAVAGLGWMEERSPLLMRRASAVAVTMTIALLAYGSHAYAGLFTDGETLWTYDLQSNPNEWPAYNNRGHYLMKTGRTDEARADYLRGIQLKPDNVDLHNNLGVLLVQTGRTEEGIAQYREATRLDPKSYLAHTNLGQVLMTQGKGSEAMAEFKQALRINPTYTDAYLNLGLALVQAGKSAAAQACFETAVKLEPENIQAHSALGSLLLKNDRLPEAMAQYEAVLRFDPDNAIAHYNKGNGLMQTDQTAEAMEEYHRALQTDPTMAEAHYSLGNALVQSGQLAEAMEEYQSALKIDPGYADAHTNLGNALLQSGRQSEAIEQYRQSLKITPNDIDVRKPLGMVLLQAGRTAEAREQFEAILQIAPQDEDARRALARMAALPK